MYSYWLIGGVESHGRCARPEAKQTIPRKRMMMMMSGDAVGVCVYARSSLYGVSALSQFMLRTAPYASLGCVSEPAEAQCWSLRAERAHDP